MQLDNSSFRVWLVNEKGFTAKSAADIVSRLNRASIFLAKDVEGRSAAELKFLLTQHPEFLSLSTSVRSQLRRSVQLAKEFENWKSPQ